MMRRAVALAPSDPALRSRMRGVSWSGDRSAASRSDTLLAARPMLLLMARGRMYGWSGNMAMAERDVAAATELKPTAESFAMLGDLYRWRGERVQAREAYDRARVLNPGDAQAGAGLAELDLFQLHDAEAFFERDRIRSVRLLPRRQRRLRSLFRRAECGFGLGSRGCCVRRR
jgi:Flp pilus assembly protein TadD